jgi:hypothetical protein
VVDVSSALAPSPLGPVTMPGRPRGGAWIGDTLLVATGLALERLRVSPIPAAAPSLDIGYDAGSELPRAVISWSPVAVTGLVGLNLRRDILSPPGAPDGIGEAVNGSMLPPSATQFEDDALEAGFTYRYRLEAVLSDGSTRDVAEGTLAVPESPGVGSPYPNPYTVSAGVLRIPYRISKGGGTIEVRVFDVHGQLVRGFATPAPAGGGFGSAAWDGRDQDGSAVATGVYFVRLVGPGIDDARQVVLLH